MDTDCDNSYGIILAAGLSSRMGAECKPLLKLGKSSMLSMAIGALRTGGLAHLFVVTGHRQAAVTVEAERCGATAVHNALFGQGMFSSVRTGLHAVAAHMACRTQNRDRSGVLLLLPVDAALIKPHTITTLLSTWRSLAENDFEKARNTIIIPAHAGRTGHPLLMGAGHVARILAWHTSHRQIPTGGLRNYLEQLLPLKPTASFLQRLTPYTLAPVSTQKRAAPPQTSLSGCCAPWLRDDAALNGNERFPVFFLSLPDAGLLSDMDTPTDVAKAKEFLKLSRNRLHPTLEEAWEWLCHSGLDEKKVRHSVLVALGALRLCLALQARAYAAKPLLAVTGGLLHDIARFCITGPGKCKAHANIGQALLEKAGWKETGMVVGAHTALPNSLLTRLGIPLKDTPVTCRRLLDNKESACLIASYKDRGGIVAPPDSAADPFTSAPPGLINTCTAVYLADKYFFMDKPVTLAKRFAIVKERYRGDVVAEQAIDHREKVAHAVVAWYAAALAESPEQVILRGMEYAPSPAAKADSRQKTSPPLLERALLQLLLADNTTTVITGSE